jgi:hypothetical protein
MPQDCRFRRKRQCFRTRSASVMVSPAAQPALAKQPSCRSPLTLRHAYLTYDGRSYLR